MNNPLGLPDREEAARMPIHGFAHTTSSAVLKLLMIRALAEIKDKNGFLVTMAAALAPFLHEMAMQTADHTEMIEAAKKAGNSDGITAILNAYDSSKNCKPQNVLFAALLAARMVPDVGDRETLAIELGPEQLQDAIDDFEKLTGRAPDGILDPEMVKTIRRFTEEKSKENPLQALLAGRKSKPETRNNPLN